MTSINVQGVNLDTFGNKMPNVFINRIFIKNVPGLIPGTSDAQFEIMLSLKFSKPEHFQAGTARAFIKDKLKDVYLYTYLTYKNEIKTKLEQNNFSLKQWHIKGMNYPSHHKKYSDPRFKRIPISSLIEDESYGSEIIIGPEFDESGNETISIANIKITITYLMHDGLTESDIPSLSSIENLMFFAYTGPRAHGTYDGSSTLGDGPGDAPDDISDLDTQGIFARRFDEFPYPDEVYSTPSSFASSINQNAYFSDISYYHILKFNRIATKFFETYTTPDGTPYYGQVLQSTNGKFYSTDNFSFTEVKEKLEAFIDTHKDNRQLDPDLDANIKNLEAIINSTDNKSGILTELSNYRATYPNKSPTTLSGQFYAEFIVEFADVLQIVQTQPELSVKMLYDSLVTDERFGLQDGVYIPPAPSLMGTVGAPKPSGISYPDVIRGTPYTNTGDGDDGVPSDCYIPKKWFLLARKAYLIDSISQLSDDALDYLYNTGGGIADSFREAATYADEGAVLSNLIQDLTNRYESEGFTTEQARKLAKQYLSFYFSTSTGIESEGSAITQTYAMLGGGTFPGGTTRSELLNPTLNLGDYISLRSGDAVVQNNGTFMFDYEKAVRSQSLISHVFNIDKLQKLFRINVPYEHFYVKRVELSRNEVRLEDPDSDSSGAKPYIRVKMQLNLQRPTLYNSADEPVVEIIDYPKNKSIDYKFFGGNASDNFDNYAVKLKYLRPLYTIGGAYGSNKKHSFLRFVNFDLPTPTESARLKSFNSMEGTATGGLGGLVNAKVLDGYRLMMFHFADVMDDDVAALNTQALSDELNSATSIRSKESDYSGPGGLLAGSNALGEQRTCYSVVVEVVDQTQLTYDEFVSYIVGIYNEFTEFYTTAAEICSFNNITNEFNEFFTDSINETYTDNKIWITSAYIVAALSELMFGGAAFDEDIFQENVLETVVKISPATGNLFQLSAFAEKFKGLLDYLTRESLDLVDPFYGPGPDEMTPSRRVDELTPGKIIQFYNEKPIWEPISGDVTPDNTSLDKLSMIGSPVPFPLFMRPFLSTSAIDVPRDTSTSALTTALSAAGELTGTPIYRGEVYPLEGGLPDYGIDLAGIDGSPKLTRDSVYYNAACIFELIFFPKTLFLEIDADISEGAAENIILDFYNYRGTMPGMFDTIVRRRWGPYVTGVMGFGPTDFSKWEAKLDSKLKESYGTYTTLITSWIDGSLFETSRDLSFAAHFINEIFKFSTVDVKAVTIESAAAGLFDSGAGGNRYVGRLRAERTGRDLDDRRDRRTVISALVLLELIAIAISDSAGYSASNRFPAPYDHSTGLSPVLYNAFFSKEYVNAASATGKILSLSAGGEPIKNERRCEMFEQLLYRGRATIQRLREILGRAAYRQATRDLIGDASEVPAVFSEVDEYDGLRDCFPRESVEAAIGITTGLMGDTGTLRATVSGIIDRALSGATGFTVTDGIS